MSTVGDEFSEAWAELAARLVVDADDESNSADEPIQQPKSNSELHLQPGMTSEKYIDQRHKEEKAKHVLWVYDPYTKKNYDVLALPPNSQTNGRITVVVISTDQEGKLKGEFEWDWPLKVTATEVGNQLYDVRITAPEEGNREVFFERMSEEACEEMALAFREVEKRHIHLQRAAQPSPACG